MLYTLDTDPITTAAHERNNMSIYEKHLREQLEQERGENERLQAKIEELEDKLDTLDRLCLRANLSGRRSDEARCQSYQVFQCCKPAGHYGNCKLV